MLKASAGDLIIIGLSKMNIDHLQEGRPIVFDLKEVAMDEIKRVFIFAGDTEETMLKDIEQLIHPSLR